MEELIGSLSFFRNKSKNIIATAKKLKEEYQGRIPDTIEELVQFPGIGDKVASAILVNIHNKPAIVVDTHVSRVAKRLQWSDKKQAIKIKRDLETFIPEKDQVAAGNALVLFGRYICKAKKPECSKCPILATCAHYRTISNETS